MGFIAQRHEQFVFDLAQKNLAFLKGKCAFEITLCDQEFEQTVQACGKIRFWNPFWFGV